MAPPGTSQFIKNGQQISVPAGSAPIAVTDLVVLGGLGAQAWPVATMDYAASANAATLLAVTGVTNFALPGSTRQPMARDRLGNIYQTGTNGSGHLVMFKRGPFGNSPISATLDSSATSVNSAYLFQLQNGNFCCVYARATGAMYFVIFDSMLSVIAGPSSVATERAATNVVYHCAIPLAAGGFAIAYQNTAATSLRLVTYSNAGAVVLANTNVQTLAGGAAQAYLGMVQLSNGNLALAYRSTMTAGGNAGTSVNVFTTAGVAVSGPTSIDLTSSLGLLEINALPSGGFAVALGNGTNLVASVFNDAGAAQGSQFSVANTLMATTYPQLKLTNDGVRFWLTYFSSAGNGLYVLGLTTGGVTYATASGLGSGTLAASTFSLDAEVINGMIVALACSSGTGGQFWMTIGLPDGSLSVSAPYVRTQPTTIGTAAATTGTNWPRVLSGGSGFFRGSGGPANQPTNPATVGDFTAILSYAQANSASTLVAVVKVEQSAIVGIASAAVGIGSQGTPFYVNPGQGEYSTTSTGGSSGIQFNHLSNALGGTSGTLYANGVALSGIATGGAGSGGGGSTPSGLIGVPLPFAGPIANAPANALACYGQLVSRTAYAALFAVIGTEWGAGDGVTTFAIPDLRGRVWAGLDDMGGTPAGRLTSATMNPDGITIGAEGGVEEKVFAYSGTTAANGGNINSANAAGQSTAPGSHTHTYSGNTTISSILQPTVAGNWIIYFA